MDYALKINVISLAVVYAIALYMIWPFRKFFDKFAINQTLIKHYE